MENHLALMIRTSVERYGDRIAMRSRGRGEWEEIAYNSLGERIRLIAKALLEYKVDEGEMVGIFSQNRPEWAMADFGILSVKGVSVPIYATNTAKQAEYIVNDAQIKTIFVGDQIQYDKVKSFFESSQSLRNIIVFDEAVALKGDESIHFREFLRLGEGSAREGEIDERLNTVSSDDIATLIYTSGTTGDPKGVMLTHANFFHQFYAVDENFNVSREDRSLCFLPLSHVYERTWSYYVFSKGAENNYLEDPKKVIEYFQEVKPTAMVSVPRLYEKIYSTVFDRLERESAFKSKLFKWAIGIGKEYRYAIKDKRFIGPYLGFRHRVADGLVLKKIRDIVGGPKNFFSAGGAPLSKDIEEFFFAAGLLICQGYGLTESSPMISYNTPGDFKFGTVGKPVPGCEVRISDNGEILAKGPNIMRGYYNKPEETEQTIVDGWLKTGDVGIIDKEGFLIITDRIKDLIITSGGKNIAPQHIETEVGKDHYIEQIAVIGDRRKFVSALVVPSFLALEEYARENNIAFSTREELISRKEIIDFFQRRIESQSEELANYERIKRFTLLSSEFTQDGDELTPTLKIKRKVIAERYRDIIDAMYAEGESVS
jgi:long-chain acyl-CoA synthetase